MRTPRVSVKGGGIPIIAFAGGLPWGREIGAEEEIKLSKDRGPASHQKNHKCGNNSALTTG